MKRLSPVARNGRMRAIRPGALAVVLGVLVAGCATADRAAPAPAAPLVARTQAGDVVVGAAGRDRTGSQSASDWISYADHVLVVTVVEEIRHPPSRSETERGEGLIGRTVRLRVDRVLWSALDAPQPPPSALELSAAGWIFNDNESRTGTRKLALRNASRLENGHTYVKAVGWIDDPCSDDPRRGTWQGLGSGDVIPFDGGVLGAGEFQGRVYTVDDARATWGGDEAWSGGVRQRMLGSSVDDLVADLRAARLRPEQDTWPGECDRSDS